MLAENKTCVRHRPRKGYKHMLATTPGGLKVAGISSHALERYCQRRKVDGHRACRRIIILAESGERILTPSGPALAVGLERLGIERVSADRPREIIVTTYYLLTIKSAVKRYLSTVRPFGLPAKRDRHPANNRYVRRWRFRRKAVARTRARRGDHSTRRRYNRTREKRSTAHAIDQIIPLSIGAACGSTCEAPAPKVPERARIRRQAVAMDEEAGRLCLAIAE
ncbi:MAG: hypothetical protein FJ288_13810 [Planctomycetes bacterium]|nr:hypothetical protein [Planctomycetota bacterium]